MPHRKRVRHYDVRGHLHELTFSCYRRKPLLTPLLTNNAWRRAFSTSIDPACRAERFGLVAFVFVPEHVHVVVYPHVAGRRVSDLLYAIKRPFSYRVKQRLIADSHPLLADLTIRQRPGRTTFRAWQEGAGHDGNLVNQRAAPAAIEYIHLNPVRRGLVERAVDFRWSSNRSTTSGRAPNGMPTTAGTSIRPCRGSRPCLRSSSVCQGWRRTD